MGFNWKDGDLTREDAERARSIVNNGAVVSTFLDALNLLKERRLKRSVSIEDFTRGLIEIATGIEKFLEHADAFSDLEIRLQIKMLEGFVEVLCDYLKTLRGECPYLKSFEELKRKREGGELPDRDYWRELIELTVRVLNFIHDANLPPSQLRFVLSVVLAMVDYFQCWLLHKKELVEDFFGENS